MILKLGQFDIWVDVPDSYFRCSPDEFHHLGFSQSRKTASVGVPPIRLAKAPAGGLAADLAELALFDFVSCESPDGPSLFFRDGVLRHAHHSPGAVEISSALTESDRIPWQVFTAALFVVFAAQGALLTHGVAFELRGKGILALGESGSGKSTLAAAVLSSGGGVASDDRLVLLRDPDGGFWAHQFRDYLAFRPTSLTLLPSALKARIRPPFYDGGGAVLSRDRLGVAARSAVKLDEIWLLQTSRARRSCNSSKRSATSQLGIGALVSSTGAFFLFETTLMNDRENAFLLLSGLVDRLPVRAVEVGTNLLVNPGTELDSLLRRS